MKHSAFILRIKNTAAREMFLFDKVYFFERRDISLLSKIFRHALVIFPNKAFVDQLEVAIKYSGCHPGKAYPLARRDEEKLKKKIEERNPIDAFFIDFEQYVAVVPILFLKKMDEQSKHEEIKPAYLLSSYDFAKRALSVPSLILSSSYFLSDGEEYRPICSICKNSLKMLVGKCHFGELACLKNISQTKPSEFMRNITRYKTWVEKLKEPEISLGADNEQLQNNPS